MFWIRRGEVLGKIFSFPFLGKHLYLLLPGGVGVNLCSLHLYVASIQAAGNCAWERESE